MLLQRVLAVLVLLPIGLIIIHFGGGVFAIFIALILALAALEYARLFQAGGLQPASGLVVFGVISLSIGRFWNAFESSAAIIGLLILLSMTYHIYKFERGSEFAGTDFAVTLTGILYLGWLGNYLISIRDLPDGKWWLLITLPAVWLADSGAYFIGRRFGKHKLSPRLSPNKTWEGYFAGILFGTLGTALLVLIYRSTTTLQTINPAQGALLGFILASVTPLGDLGESMIKRQVGIKDSSNLIPGHGGVFDRIDSWLWAAIIGYYLIVWMFI